jgi:hypothetical protein
MRTHTPGKAKSRINRALPAQAAWPATRLTEIPDWDNGDGASLSDDREYLHADRYHHIQPGDACEEDIEHAAAEMTALFRCVDPS